MSESHPVADRLNVAPETVEALAGAATHHDGVAALSEQPLLRLRNPIPSIRHALVTVPAATEDASGRAPAPLLAGYAQLDLANGSAELLVHPDLRRTGIGSTLLREIHNALGASPQPDNTTQKLRLWAHGNLSAARGFAAHHGLSPVRELHRMELAPQPAETPSPVMPEVRRFEAGRDEDALLTVNAAAFANHPEQGRLTRADFDQRAALPWFRADGIFLDEVSTNSASGVPTLRGFLWTKITDDADGPVGEIYVLGVSPDAQGQGVGARLTAAAVEYLMAQHVRRIELSVDGDNDAAIRTYRRAGFRIANTDVQYEAP